MTDSLKNVVKVALSTVSSRVLGLVRDILTFMYLGAGSVNSAFLFAFSLPNLLRRLMGEGALSSAMVPVFSSSMKKGGLESSFKFLNQVFTRAGIFLAIFVIVSIAFALLYGEFCAETYRYELGAVFSAILMPYAFFICLAALGVSALNVLGSFGLPSMGAVWLNVSMIASLLMGVYFCNNQVDIVYFSCAGILIGGFIQLAIPAWLLRKRGWRFSIDLSKSDELSALFRLFMPALLGASVVQINILVSKLLGFWLNDYAVSALYLSSRLMEMPLGVFTIAVATVYFPKLSMINVGGTKEEYIKEYSKAMTGINAISIPAAFGLALFSFDILKFLFQWKAFGKADLDICTPIVAVSALALPFISASTFAVRAFYSKQNTKTPLYVSAITFFANLIFSLLLMFKFSAFGLAMANSLSSFVQYLVLKRLFAKHIGKISISKDTVKIFISSIVMCLLAFLFRELLAIFYADKILSALVCIVIIPFAILVYAAMLWILKFEQLKDFKIFKKKKRV